MGITQEFKRYFHSPEFCGALAKKYERFEILSEGGLRTAVANLLEAKLHELGPAADSYRVTCEVHLKGANVVPDILVWKGKHPRIWIELKDTRSFSSSKARMDWEKLKKHREQCKFVKSGYLIYVARKRNRGGKADPKRDKETRRFWPIFICLADHLPEDSKWEKRYRDRSHYLVSGSTPKALRKGVNPN